jgi:hypothetical protein
VHPGASYKFSVLRCPVLSYAMLIHAYKFLK